MIILSENPRITTTKENLVEIFGLDLDRPDFDAAALKASEKGWERWEAYLLECKQAGKLLRVIEHDGDETQL